MAVVVEEEVMWWRWRRPVTLPWPIPFEYSSILFGLKSSAPPFVCDVTVEPPDAAHACQPPAPLAGGAWTATSSEP